MGFVVYGGDRVIADLKPTGEIVLMPEYTAKDAARVLWRAFNHLQYQENGVPLVTIEMATGTVQYSNGYIPSEDADTFWQEVAACFRGEKAVT